MKKKTYNMPTLSMTEISLNTAIMSGDTQPAKGNGAGGSQSTGGIGVPARRLYV